MNVIGGVSLHNLEAEHKVLGACLVSEEALLTALDSLEPEDFYSDTCRIIFSAIRDNSASGRVTDPVIIADELNRHKNLDRVGGRAFIDELIEAVTSPDTIEYYVDVIRDLSQRRKLLNAGKSIAALASDPNSTNEDVISQASQLLLTASENKLTEDFNPLKSVIEEIAFNDPDTVRHNYYTSFTDIDSITGGLPPGSLTILAARPGMGKTALALNFAQFGASIDNPVVIFSLEMPAKQLALRMMSAKSEIPLSTIINGTLSTGQFQVLTAANEDLAERRIFISDNPTLSTTDFMIKARRFKTKHPNVGLIIVDYLQLMTATRKTDSRVLEVSEISRTLKAVARELDVPVLALSQLSRAPESRTDKKPQLSDLRDSGAIEQDADLVMLLYREDYYGDNENSDLVDSKADLRVAKNRNGATGVVHLTFKREITRFVNFGEVRNFQP